MIYFDKKIRTASDLKSRWGVDSNTFKKRLNYQIKTGKFIKLRKGLYIFADQIGNLQEKDFLYIANTIYSPSYISFETSLQYHGVIFQDWKSITVASNYNKELEIPLIKLRIKFLKINQYLLLEKIGLQEQSNFHIATKERAICDVVLKSENYYFDNLDNVDLKLLTQIADIYSIFYKGFKQKLHKYFNTI